MLGLIDLQSMYTSVEVAFDPRLRGKPVVVLGNGESVIVARSPEAKALGLPMGAPIFEWRDLIDHAGVVVRSSNYPLYGDMSERVYSILREAVPDLQVDSIDECFLPMAKVRDPVGLAHELMNRISRGVGLPCRVGLGPNRLFAKLANRLAKKRGGVVDLNPVREREQVLETTPVADLWGIASRWSQRLNALGIDNALQLRDAPPALLRKRFGVVMARIQGELSGYNCIQVNDVEPDRRQIFVTRGFGQAITELSAMREAIAVYVERAAEKMRARGLRANALHVFMHTSPFRSDAQYSASATGPLPVPTGDTRTLLRLARALTDRMWRSGYRFAKGGVGLLDLSRVDRTQGDLFAGETERQGRAMDVVDRINGKFGRGTVRFAAQGATPVRAWSQRQAHLSPAYTTRWSDIIVAR